MGMDKVERILTLFFRLYQGKKISKMAFMLEMEINSRTFERDIEAIRMFLSESFSFHEVVFDRARNVYYMTGSKQEELTDVEFTTAATILIGSKALGKQEMTGLVNQLYRITHGKNTVPWEMLKEELYNYDRKAPEKPILKTQWDLAQCIIRKKVIRLLTVNGTSKEGAEIVPLKLFYENNVLWLVFFEVSGNLQRRMPVEEIEAFEIIGSQSENDYK